MTGPKMAYLLMGAGYRLAQAAFPAPQEDNPERDAALWALADVAGREGWTLQALRTAAGPDADLLFASDRVALVEAWADLVDREMLRRVRDLSGLEGEEPRLSRRVRQAILIRLDILEPYRAAERRAVACLATSCAAGARGRVLGRTLNAIWRAAADEATGVTWVTKRISLAGVYVPVFLAWLGGVDRATVERLLDKGLARVRRIGEARRMISGRLGVRAA